MCRGRCMSLTLYIKVDCRCDKQASVVGRLLMDNGKIFQVQTPGESSREKYPYITLHYIEVI